jgi:protein SCO1
MKNSRLWLLAGGGLLLGLVLTAAILILRPFGPPNFHGTVLQSSQPAQNFSLTAHTGEEVSLHDFHGKVTLLYFGYAYCPDVCPATMGELARAMRALRPSQQEQVQVIMVTVDPERDTLEILADYMAYFHPTFLGLTGSEEEIAAAATPLGIYYEKEEGSVASGYLVNHTASVLVLDKRGHLRLVYPFDTNGEDIAEDLRYLVRE